MDFLVPTPREIKELGGEFSLPRKVKIISKGQSNSETVRMLAGDLQDICGMEVSDFAEFAIDLAVDAEIAQSEGYSLELSDVKAVLRGHDETGLFYATQTLLQIFALSEGEIPKIKIIDWPHYKVRSVMPDIGRAPYSSALLKRLIRIMARLKLNSLHLHLFDDYLNGIRFENLPLGSENSFALPVSEYGEIIKYARRYHVSVVPEFECWGHAGSILYHYPKLYGAPGMWEGFSFGIGEELYELFEKMFDEFVPVLEDKCVFHVGLDEAKWATLQSVKDQSEYSPTTHVGSLYDILQKYGAKHGKEITMRLWADHGGRPLPDVLEDKVIVEPWMYFEGRANAILEKIAAYSGEGKTKFIMGGGMSQMHIDGHYGATRIWCQEGKDAPNVEGINICMWMSNNLSGRLLGVYGGSHYAWNPYREEETRPDDGVGEWARGRMHRRMRRWQAAFSDANPHAIDADRGHEVFAGKFCWQPYAGLPVAPTALLIDPRTVDAFDEDRAE